MVRDTSSLSAGRPVGLAGFAATLAPYSQVFLRVLMGITFLLHGLPKFSNIGGFSGMLSSMGVPLPGVTSILVPVLEVGGGILLILGFGTRIVSLLFVALMLVTTLMVKSNMGFIGQQGAGAELDLLLLAGALILFCYGAGPLSVDRNVLKHTV